MSEDEENYQDDFEDYEDDFEDDAEIEAAPHFTCRSTSETQYQEEDRNPSVNPSSGHDIGSSYLAPREVNRGMQKKTFLPSKEALGPSDAQRAILHQRCARWRALKPLLKLGVMEWDCLFELAPLTPYELLRRGLGDFSTKKAARTQTGDDTHTEEVQTNDVECEDQQCQVPEDREKSWKELQQTKDRCTSSTAHQGAVVQEGLGHTSVRLTDFIQRASTMVLAILSGQKLVVRPTITFNSSWCFNGISDASLSLPPDKSGTQKPVTQVSLAPGLEPLLLVTHSSVGAAKALPQLDGKEPRRKTECSAPGWILLWHLNHVHGPLARLSSEGIPSCCCWSPGEVQQFVFAGMEEGGICMWDIRDIVGSLSSAIEGNMKVLHPVYTTEYAPDHQFAAPIVDLVAVDLQPQKQHLQNSLEQKLRHLRGDTYIELICLSAWGHVMIMGVKELTELDAASAEQSDWGLRIGGRVRLVSIASGVPLGHQHKPTSTNQDLEAPQAMCVACSPKYPYGIFVGCDGGNILRGVRSGQLPPPRLYSPYQFLLRSTRTSPHILCWEGNRDIPCTGINQENHVGLQSASQLWRQSTASHATVTTLVTCLSISHCLPNVFIAGHSESLLALYVMNKAHPLRVWEGIASGGVASVRFLATRASIFLSLFTPSSTLCCIDLLAEGEGVISKLNVAKDGCSAVSMDLSKGSIGEGPSLIVGYEDGSIQVHRISEVLAKGRTAEEVLVFERLAELC